MKLSGPATNRRRSRSRNAPGGRVRCSARLGGATTGRKPPEPSTACAPAACDGGAAATAQRQGARRRGTGAARSRGPTDVDIGAAGCREPERTPGCPSRLTLKLSGPATDSDPRATETRPVAGSAAGARLDGATTGRKPPRARRLAPPVARDDGTAATAPRRRSPTGHRRRPQQGTDRYGYRRRRMPRAGAHAPLPEPANVEAQRTGHREQAIAPPNAPCGRVRCSARLGGAPAGRKPPTPSPTCARPAASDGGAAATAPRQGARRLGTGAARSRGPTDMDIGAAGCREPKRTPRWLSRLTMKLSGPATDRRRSRSPKRALWPGPLQRQVRRRGQRAASPPRHRRRARPAACDDGAAATAPRRRSPTGHRRRPQQGTDRARYRRRRMPRAGAHARLPSRLTPKLSGPATHRRRSRRRNAPGGRVRCSARLDGATTGRKTLSPRRRAHPAASDDGAAATAPRQALANGAPAPPAAGDRPILISAPPDAASRSGRPVARAG